MMADPGLAQIKALLDTPRHGATAAAHRLATALDRPVAPDTTTADWPRPAKGARTAIRDLRAFYGGLRKQIAAVPTRQPQKEVILTALDRIDDALDLFDAALYPTLTREAQQDSFTLATNLSRSGRKKLMRAYNSL